MLPAARIKQKIVSARIHDGMGYFFLTPQTGVTYSAKWKDEKGVERTYSFAKNKKRWRRFAELVLQEPTGYFLSACSPDIDKFTMDTVHLVGTLYQHQVFQVAKATGSSDNKGNYSYR